MIGGDAAVTERMKVFVSYSRDDVAFADQLVVALEDRGFEPILDRHNIDAAENWKERLGTLILSCDATVFVLTESSAGSPVCAWEVEEAVRLGKRIVPIVPREVKASPPPALGDLNWIHFYTTADVPGSGMFEGLRKLDRALKVDLAWLRQQTVLQEEAARWTGRAQTLDSPHLLRGAILQEAQDWMRRTPATTGVPFEVRQFIEASASYEERLKAEAQAGIAEREAALRAATQAAAENAKAQDRVRFVSLVALVVGVVLSGVAVVGGWFAVDNYVRASETRSALVAREANSLFDQGLYAKAALMALYGDPAAKSGIAEGMLRPEGYGAARDALVRAATHNRLLGMQGKARDLPVTSIVFHPDGERFLAASADGKTRLFRIGEDKPIAEFGEAGEPFEVGALAVAFHPDGERFLVGSFDGKARLWWIGEDKPIATLDAGGGAVFSVAFHPDGERFMTGTTEGNVRQWKIGQADPVAAESYEQSDFVSFHPDGERFLSVQENKLEVRRFGQKAPLATFEGEFGWSAFLPGDKYMLTATREGTFRLWRISDGQWMLDRSDGGGEVTSIAPLPDGERFLAVTADGKIRLWSTAHGRDEPLAVFRDGAGLNFSVALHPDGRRFIGGGMNGRFTFWRLDADTPVASIGGMRGEVIFHPDGEQVMINLSGKLTTWRVGEDKPVGEVVDAGGEVVSLAFDREGRRFIAGLKDRSVKLWRTGEQAPMATFKADGAVVEFSFHPDGERIVAAEFVGKSSDIKVVRWRFGEDKPESVSDQLDDGLTWARLLPDGERFLTGTEDLKIRLWRIGDKAPLATTDSLGGRVRRVAIDPDGERFLMETEDGKARLWRVGGDKPLAVFDAGGAEMEAVTMLPDRERFLAAYDDGRARLWRIGDERPLAIIEGTGSDVYGLKLHPDGKSFLSLTDGSRVLKWAIPEIALASAGRQAELACAALYEIGGVEFSDEDYQRFPLLDRNAPHPCAKMWRSDPRVKSGGIGRSEAPGDPAASAPQ